MPDEVVYVDRFQLREGKVESFRRWASDMATFVRENEPGTAVFNYYVDEDTGKGTAVFVFQDADALDRHIELAASRFNEAYEFVSSTEIDLLGQPSGSASELAKRFGGHVTTKLAGFSRIAS
ncbi:MAG: hypothetical protein M3N24_05855 [Actinomycetota bacterium]|nr:hypothetical protein [Actinomycetota bacterium]